MVDEDGKNLVNSVWLPKADRNHKWVMQQIPDGKEIIGIYGNNDSSKSSLIKSLGFVLWTVQDPIETRYRLLPSITPQIQLNR